MLAETDARVADIASRLGYAEPSAFHRAFMKWTGMSPGAFRDANPPRCRRLICAISGNIRSTIWSRRMNFHLAGHRNREFLDEFDIARHLVMGDLALAKGAQFLEKPSGWDRRP